MGEFELVSCAKRGKPERLLQFTALRSGVELRLDEETDGARRPQSGCIQGDRPVPRLPLLVLVGHAYDRSSREGAGQVVEFLGLPLVTRLLDLPETRARRLGVRHALGIALGTKPHVVGPEI